MTYTGPNDSAHPHGHDNDTGSAQTPGLTKREYMAAHVMATLVGSASHLHMANLADLSVKAADALITELNATAHE